MIDQLYKTYLQSHTVTTDSRAITPGCIFFAFKGEKFDGNAFAPQALEQGAALCVISDPQYKTDDRCIVVDDVLETLQELAREHRRHLTIPVIGITGTNGKTTTKELVHAVLAKRYRTSATKGNFNNHLGVPLTLLSIPANTELAIVEMGANHPGEIAFLCGIADPDLGLITNVGRAHLEGFGSFEGVVQTKTELYRHLAMKGERLKVKGERCPTIFVNADNPILISHLSPLTSHRTYGRSQGADVRGTIVDGTGEHVAPYLHFYFEVGDNVYNVHTHLLGGYNFDNCMAAVAVGLHFGVEPWDIKEAIEEYVPSNQRSEYKETARGNRLYLDCYNANPSSMAAAIDSFKGMGGTMAVIGGMHELGADERVEHERLMEQLEACHLDKCLLVGPEWYKIENSKLKNENSNFMLFPDTDSVRIWLQEHPVSGATILVKGSNTNRLWTLEELL
ncbi:MAG: UDP-N-acetylmuramoyl-tripeptide--D-alanyl-D-alanine ligase [Bacteroidales bacterium]|nr:UDP-N-acetylmuramoyl-tripeptide--D-alanyl-D-alanine ligase [Bacteroidales bacterium]